jgi:hypothetical protein
LSNGAKYAAPRKKGCLEIKKHTKNELLFAW